ncbi:MAG TPA: O-antigen ligase family protein [Candidatus Saccharimonadales bacterium]|nr:O-antigen ligase family protein [Candidatus Saccharimonadales bacterium]
MLLQNQSAKVAIAHSPSVQDKIETILFSLLLLFLPTQFGKHFWPPFSFILGQRIDYLSPTLYVTDILIFLLFIIWVIEAGHKHKNTVPLLGGGWGWVTSALLVILVILFFTFNISLSPSPQEGLYGLLKLFEIGFLTYYTGNILRTNQKIILFPLVFGIISESVLATLQFFTQGSLGGILYYFGERTFTSVTPGIANASINGQLLLRPYGTFSHPNVLAGYLVIGMTILLMCHPGCAALIKASTLGVTRIWGGDKASRNFGSQDSGQAGMTKNFFYLFTLLIGTVGLCLTLSRVAILVWVFVCAFLLIRYFQKRLFPKKILLIANGLLGFFVVALFIISPLIPRFSQLTMQDESVVLREQLATDAFNMMFAHPVFGVGLHNFLIALPHYDFSRGSVFSIQPVHNIFLLTGAETGFVGLWIFMSFVIWLYIKLFKQYRLSVCIIFLTEIILLGSFDHYFLTIQQGQLLLGLVIGICFSVLS